jgi:hypothetical protein
VEYFLLLPKKGLATPRDLKNNWTRYGTNNFLGPLMRAGTRHIDQWLFRYEIIKVSSLHSHWSSGNVLILMGDWCGRKEVIPTAEKASEYISMQGKDAFFSLTGSIIP